MGLLKGRLPWWWLIATTWVWLSGCAATSPEARTANTLAWASDQGWAPVVLPGEDFDVQAFVPGHLRKVRRLTVYLEGDGLAWVDRDTPSFAPTPVDPVGFRLAVADAGGQAVHLARPCQYTQGAAFKGCHPRYWGTHRFAPEVIGAMDRAVQQLKSRYAADELVLVGYSGGAAVAALVAARRDDVVALVTVAGTLDTDVWTQAQRVSPLHGSLNPRAVSSNVARVPQWHFVGGKDEVVTPAVLASFLGGAAGPQPRHTAAPIVETVPDFDHACCWVRAWPEMSRRFAVPDARR